MPDMDVVHTALVESVVNMVATVKWSFRLQVVPEPVDVVYFDPNTVETAHLQPGDRVFGLDKAESAHTFVFLSVGPQ